MTPSDGSTPATADQPNADAPRLRDVAHAAARGIVAAMAMTGMRAVTGGAEMLAETPPQAVFRQRLQPLLKSVPRRRRNVAIELAHWAYGAAGGAAYAFVPSALRSRPYTGPAYGLAIWAGFEFGVVPALGLRQWRRTDRNIERLALVGDHLLYGLVVSEIRPAHRAAR